MVNQGGKAMPHGYDGKILQVHLDKMTYQFEEPEESFYKKYTGGSALACIMP